MRGSSTPRQTVRIALWSGPRNISTAMMRSFGARGDAAVSDEPFLGAYLKASGERQPMADEIVATMDCDFDSVLASICGEAPGGAGIWYQKHMPHHMVGDVSIEDMPDHRHAFLIRRPERMVASYAAKNELTRPEVLGTAKMRRYFDTAMERTGTVPPVIDCDDVLADPAGVLRALCAGLAIPWTDAMLSWKKGPHPEDGIWGAHWYESVNASTGFADPPGEPRPLAADLQRIADACRADYEAMHRHRLRAATA